MSCSYLLRGWAISNHGIHVGIAYSALLSWGLTAGHARFLGTGLGHNGTLHPSGVLPSECLGTLPPLLACRRLVIMTAMLSSLRSISMFGISSQSFPKSFFFLEYCQQWTIFTLYFWKEKEKKKDNDYSEPSVVRRVSNGAMECYSGWNRCHLQRNRWIVIWLINWLWKQFPEKTWVISLDKF